VVERERGADERLRHDFDRDGAVREAPVPIIGARRLGLEQKGRGLRDVADVGETIAEDDEIGDGAGGGGRGEEEERHEG
jgi:hypothetical protein